MCQEVAKRRSDLARKHGKYGFEASMFGVGSNPNLLIKKTSQYIEDYNGRIEGF